MQMKDSNHSQPSSIESTNRVGNDARKLPLHRAHYTDLPRHAPHSVTYSGGEPRHAPPAKGPSSVPNFNVLRAGIERSSDVDMDVDNDAGNAYTNTDTANQRVKAPVTTIDRSFEPSTTNLENESSKGTLSHGSSLIPNVLVFGETGTGKSSLINMIAGHSVAGVSNGALGCTFRSSEHVVQIDGAPFKLWDTAGLNEGEQGSVPADQAMENLKELVHRLKGGVSLLVYCIRGTRFRDILEVNYDLFTSIICRGSVPTVVVVTGLEHEDPMDKWWEENEFEFAERGMRFAGHACVTTTKGKEMRSGRHMFEEEYGESQKAVRELVTKNYSSAPWVMNERVWLKQVTSELAREKAMGGGAAESGLRDGHARRRSDASSSRLALLWGVVQFFGRVLIGYR